MNISKFVSQQTTASLDLIPAESIRLFQNYPNPFYPSTTITYDLSKSGNVTLKIFDNSGRELETLLRRFESAGEHQLEWSPIGLPGGLYFYQLQGDTFTETKKLILQK